MNGSYNYLVHPTLKPEENLKSTESGKYLYMVDIFEASKTGIIEYDFFGVDKLMGFSHLSNQWIIGVAPTYKEVYAVSAVC